MNENLRNEANAKLPPELGTPEAGVLGFVHLLSYQLEVAEDYLSYWLDAYYQLRLQYERERREAPDSCFIRREDLEAVMRKLWRETLNKGEREEAAKRLEQRVSAADENKRERHLKDFEPVPPALASPAAAAFKCEQKARLEELRKRGVTMGMIAQASDGMVTEGLMLDILGGRRVAIEDYRLLKKAMDAAAPPEK